jgi:hypothetical protein
MVTEKLKEVRGGIDKRALRRPPLWQRRPNTMKRGQIKNIICV